MGNEQFIDYITEHFAPVKGCAVLYNGPDGELEIKGKDEKVRYINAEEFLKEIHDLETIKTQDIDVEQLFHGKVQKAPIRELYRYVYTQSEYLARTEPEPERELLTKKEIEERDGGGSFFQDGASVSYDKAILGSVFLGSDAKIDRWSDVYACGRREGEESKVSQEFLPLELSFYRNKDNKMSASWVQDGKSIVTDNPQELWSTALNEEQEKALGVVARCAKEQIFGLYQSAGKIDNENQLSEENLDLPEWDDDNLNL